MSTFDGNNFYFSGQGVVLLGLRDALGKPRGLRPIGNVPDLKLAIATTVLDHKESQTGQRAIDLRLQTETKCDLTAVVENFISKNLALAMRGSVQELAAGEVTGETVDGFLGMVSGLEHAVVSDVVVSLAGGAALIPYTDEDTPWDYKLNADAGSILLNDGSVQELASGLEGSGEAVTGVTVGATTSFAVVDPTIAVGDNVLLDGFTGADMALLNGKTVPVLTNTGTAITVGINTTGKVITLGAGSLVAENKLVPLEVDYSYAAQNQVDVMTQGVEDYFLRFEGLNTADSNKPVIVEVWKFSSSPLKELSLIGDTVQQFTLEGAVLADPLRPSGSKFFKVTMLR